MQRFFSKTRFCDGAEWPNEMGITVVNDPGKVITYIENTGYNYCICHYYIVMSSYVIVVASSTRLLTCLANTSRVMKKMKRDTEPIVFRSFSTPGLDRERGNTIITMLIVWCQSLVLLYHQQMKKTKSTMS